uniref:ORF11 protein n=1 Tax=Plutella xylostella granulovirus TaxID=98383 RepID=A0A7U3MXK0_9BBAC|nr:ORF11 protein [Plutella xylostella granulovirus]QKV50054.1 ORF11 protein [Plutella xylostella granulovirus]
MFFVFTKANVTRDLIMQIAHTNDSYIQFNYAITVSDAIPTTTRVVSGLDSSRTIKCFISVNDNSIDNNAYYMNVFRLDCLCVDFVEKCLNTMVVMRMVVPDGVQFWYIFGLKKGTVPKSPVTTIKVNNHIFERDVVKLSGNVPDDLVKTLNSCKIKNVNCLHALSINESKISNQTVTLMK